MNGSTLGWSILLLLSTSAIGCGESPDAEYAAVRERFTLEKIPGGETSVSDVRKALSESGDATQKQDVVLRCRVDAGDFSPWVDGKAMFLVTDATGHDGNEAEHNPHECPFCSRDINSYMAQIVFREEDGNAIPIAAEQLFDLEKRQLVVIQGACSINEQDLLIVEATGIHFPR